MPLVTSTTTTGWRVPRALTAAPSWGPCRCAKALPLAAKAKMTAPAMTVLFMGASQEQKWSRTVSVGSTCASSLKALTQPPELPEKQASVEVVSGPLITTLLIQRRRIQLDCEFGVAPIAAPATYPAGLSPASRCRTVSRLDTSDHKQQNPPLE